VTFAAQPAKAPQNVEVTIWFGQQISSPILSNQALNKCDGLDKMADPNFA
jgi:hypothetical protein